MIFLFTLMLSLAEAKVYDKAVAIRCHDGDTCTMLTKEDGVIEVRLWGIDAPELEQDMGLIAKFVLEQNAKMLVVRLECVGKSYNRQVCMVYNEYKNVNERLVRLGLAYDVPEYSKGFFKKDEEYARENKKGVWSRLVRIKPWCYRNPNKKGC